MKVARLFTVALLGVVAAGAVLASSASAIPKFKLPITKRGFTATSSTSVVRFPTEDDVLTCGKSQATGGILGDDEVDLTIHYLGCFLSEGKNGPCTIKSVGAPGSEGLILTALLLGLLGLLFEPSGAAGILLVPKGTHVFTTWAPTSSPCKTSTTAVEGSIGALYLPTDKRQSTALINLGPVSPEGRQQVAQILVLGGIVKPKLTSIGVTETTQEQAITLTFEEAVEVD